MREAGEDELARPGVSLFFSALAAGLAALPIGALSLRTGGVHFIMITLAFAQMIYYFALSWPAYGGEDGLSLPRRGSLGGLNTMDPWTFFLIAFGLLLLVLALTLAQWSLRRRLVFYED